MGIQFMQAIANDAGQEMREVPAKFRFSCGVTFYRPGWAGLCFGMDGKHGWAMFADVHRQEAHFLRRICRTNFRVSGMKSASFPAVSAESVLIY